MDCTKTGFYGPGLEQKYEGGGKVTVCEGTVYDVSQDFLRTRSHNCNVQYHQDGSAEWRWQRYRFRSGREHFVGQRGQAYGHICRILDSSNIWSQSLAPMDLVFLFAELESSGWSRSTFMNCLHRTLAGSPQLAPVVRLTDVLLRMTTAECRTLRKGVRLLPVVF